MGLKPVISFSTLTRKINNEKYYTIYLPVLIELILHLRSPQWSYLQK